MTSAGRTPDRVVVISDDITKTGGAAAMALHSIELLTEAGVKVVCLAARPDLDPTLAKRGVDAQALGGSTISGAGGVRAAIGGLFDVGVQARLSRWIAYNDTPGTIYHLHNWHKALSPAAFLPLGRVASRLVMSAHDYFLVCPNGGYFDFRAGEVCGRTPMSISCLACNCDKRHYAHKAWRVARQAMRSALFPLAGTKAVALAPHAGMVEFLYRGGLARENIRVVRNPVTPWRDSRVAAEGNRRILFVGRLERDKGVDLLAAAAAHAGINLTIVGDGPLRETLQQNHPHCELLGWRQRAEIAELARDARLVVVPTLWPETFGLVTFEAAMSGMPVLISQNALASADIVSQDAGERFDPTDVSAAAAALRRLSSDDAAIERMSRTAFRSRADFAPTPHGWRDQLLDIYAEVLARAEQTNPVGTRFTPERSSDAVA